MNEIADSLSTHEISGLLGVSPGAVINWIEKGLFGSFRTPGGHRRVLRQDLLDFLKAQNIPVPPSLLPIPRILVADDEAPVRRLFEKLFKPEQALVKTVGNGFEALIEVGKFDPTVIVLDIRMPGLDGIQTCRKIREMGLPCAIVVISGVDIEENRKLVLKNGADAFVAKPFSVKEIRQVLERFCRRPWRLTPRASYR